MPRFRKKPVVIDAVRFTGTNRNEVFAFCPEAGEHFNGNIVILTLEGKLTAIPGDWIIKGVAGEFYPCKPDIFDATYAPVDA